MLDNFEKFLNLLEWFLTSNYRWLIIGIVVFFILYKSLRDLIVSFISDFKWLFKHLFIIPTKAIIQGLAYVLGYPSRVMRRKRLKESQFNVVPQIDYSTY